MRTTLVRHSVCKCGFYRSFSLTHAIFSETSHTEKTIQMFMPEGKLDLGTPPRHCYPLVIFLIRDTPVNSALHPDETVSTVNRIFYLAFNSYELINNWSVLKTRTVCVRDTRRSKRNAPYRFFFFFSNSVKTDSFARSCGDKTEKCFVLFYTVDTRWW